MSDIILVRRCRGRNCQKNPFEATNTARGIGEVIHFTRCGVCGERSHFYEPIDCDWYSGGWSPIGSTQHCGHQCPIVPALGDYDDGDIGGMIGKGNRSTQRKPAPVPLCPPQTPHATRAAAVGSHV
jgi:hypothetical protein